MVSASRFRISMLLVSKLLQFSCSILSWPGVCGRSRPERGLRPLLCVGGSSRGWWFWFLVRVPWFCVGGSGLGRFCVLSGLGVGSGALALVAGLRVATELERRRRAGSAPLGGVGGRLTVGARGRRGPAGWTDPLGFGPPQPAQVAATEPNAPAVMPEAASAAERGARSHSPAAHAARVSGDWARVPLDISGSEQQQGKVCRITSPCAQKPGTRAVS